MLSVEILCFILCDISFIHLELAIIEMTEGIKEILSKLDEFKQDMKNDIKRLESSLDNLNSQITEFNKRIQNLEDKYTSVNTKLKGLNRDNYFITRSNKEHNIILYNIAESENEKNEVLENIVLDLIKEKLKIEIQLMEIDRTKRLGIQRTGKRPVLVRFTTYRKRLEVLKASINLKDSPIRMSKDYTYEERQIRKQLIPFMIRARSHNYKASLRNDKLLVENEIFSLEKLQRMELEEISSIGTSTGASLASDVDTSGKEKGKKLRASRRILKKETPKGSASGNAETIKLWLKKGGTSKKLPKSRKDAQSPT